MRPGRLDRLIYVGPPDAQGREEIFRIRTKSMSIAPDVDISVLVALVSASHNPKTEFLILINYPSDRRMLRRRNHGHLSGGSHAYHAGGYQRTTCTSTFMESNSS
jgi:SpoVK/Ycf46/Vps4 family AAA+-type ATPase